MMRAFVSFCLVCFVLPATAATGVQGAVGALVAVESEGRESNYEARVPFMVRGGYSWSRIDAYLEYSTFSTGSTVGWLDIKRSQHLVLGWGRYKLPVAASGVVPYLAGGLGLQYETVRMVMNEQTTENRGEAHPVIAGATGVMLQQKFFDAGLEARISASETFRPNPTVGAAAFVGFRF